MKESDLPKLREIHEKFYREEFDFPDFLDRFLCAFVITDGSDKIICGGGVRLIAESVIVTDKDFPTDERYEALLRVLDASCFLAGQNGFKQLHAFVQGDLSWERRLAKHGFEQCKGKALVLKL